jgi:hypothetical protein
VSDPISEARARGLADCAALLSDEELPAPAPADLEPPATDPFAALDQLRRRGLEPSLVDVLWRWLEPRPLERGLFAWDVLNNSLLRHDDGRIAPFRAAAQVVAPVLPEPGRAFTNPYRCPPQKLVEEVALPAFQALDEKQQFELARLNALAALEINVTVSEKGDADLARALDTAHRFANFLSLAHLPTLATFYLSYLWRRCRYQPAKADYVEAMLDADAHGCYPARDELLEEGSVDEMELIGYLLGRDAMQLGFPGPMITEFRNAPNRTDYTQGTPAEIARTFQRSHLVYAELLLDDDEFPVPFAVVNEVVRLHPAWRYAGRVQLALLARLARGDVPMKTLDGFLAAFGNERWAWSHMDHYAPAEIDWLDAFQARIVREVTLLPHDRAAWEALGIVFLLSDDQKTWLADIQRRCAEQAAVPA